jgi:hypothetical protein
MPWFLFAFALCEIHQATHVPLMQGKTAIDIAKEEGNTTIAELLLENCR